MCVINFKLCMSCYTINKTLADHIYCIVLIFTWGFVIIEESVLFIPLLQNK